MRRLRLGFACVWDGDARRTWSYTPWELREALKRRGDVEVVDVGIMLPVVARRALQIASLRRRSGRWVMPWEHLRLWEAGAAAYLERRSAALQCDVVLQIQDLGVLSTPYLVYQDLSYDVILDLIDKGSEGLRRYFPHLVREHALRRRERQLRVYRSAAGVLAMSDFLRQSLVARTGLDPARVRTVHPGAVASAPTCSMPDPIGSNLRPAPRRRLLFVGTTFEVKAGDAVVAAFERLRLTDPQLTLTIVGPRIWPLPGSPPRGVRFLGRIDPSELSALYDGHDLLVVPSRLEGFGKVFVEALARGIPCIGRNAFAMPELIKDGENGGLVQSEKVEDLADCIARVLGDDGIYARCQAARNRVLEHFNWDRAAADVLFVAEQVLDSREGRTSTAVLGD